jgi:outer membrane murein-binding lipoprotein Lpp
MIRPLLPVLAVVLCGPGCAPRRSPEVARLAAEVTALRSQVEVTAGSARERENRATRRVTDLEASVARLERRLRDLAAARPAAPPVPAASVARCPEDLPPAVAKLREGTTEAKVRAALEGVRLQTSMTLTLTGEGEQRRTTIAGPCFRLTLEAGRLTGIAITGQAGRPAPRRPPRERPRRPGRARR